MSDNKNVDDPPKRGKSEVPDADIAVTSSEVSSIAGSVKTAKTQSRVSSSSDRQIKFERAQKCLENAALVSKRIKEHRKATAELLGRPFEDDDNADTASEMASTMSEKTGYSVATDTSTTLSVQDALNIPGISESLANTLKQKELLMERIKQYKEISKRPMKTAASPRSPSVDIKVDAKKGNNNTDVTKLMNTLKEKENALSVIQVKMKAMETTILDLQEKINEKDQIIEAKNKATTLMSDSLSKKEKDSMSLLEDTRQQMIKMQENFINMEAEWKEEKNRLLQQIEQKDEKIASLEEANTILENVRFEISLSNSKLIEELEAKNKEILNLQERINNLSYEELGDVSELTQKEKEDVEEEKGSKEIASMVELTKKVELLEQLNCQIRQTNKELENRLATSTPEAKSAASSSPSKRGSPLPTRKGGRSGAKKSPWSQLSSEPGPQEVEKKPNKNEKSKLEMIVQSLNKDILDKEYIISQKDAIISELKDSNIQQETAINELKSQIQLNTDVVDVGICTEDQLFEHLEVPKYVTPVEGLVGESDTALDATELQERLKAAEEQIISLNDEIDAANKSMLKVKSGHKLKIKQMQKTIDNFSKVSDANAEIIKLNEELHQLSQKVAELEEEKGNLQLHLVDYDSGRLTDSEVYKKMVEMENLAEARLKSISVLETQKFDLVQELHELQQKNTEMEDKLADMSHLHSEQVCSEIKSVQLEEQIDQLNSKIKELEHVIDNLKFDKKHLDESVNRLEEEKEGLLQKLENYIHENMELTDKLEKLSAEKVSSAESIEIVESLTTQEKLELEEYNKGLPDKIKDRHDKITVTPECQENIEKLVEQSAELNKKIELFTQERQEVMEKMNKINSENELLHGNILELNSYCNNLQTNIDLLTSEKLELSTLNEELSRQIEELKRERLDIMKESAEMAKPPCVEEFVETLSLESQPDDKTVGEKSTSRTKSVKQLTKEILKLKNIIKEREAEIGDCQMKILSLEEQQQKHNDLILMNSTYETKIKALTDECQQLKEEINIAKQEKSEQDLTQYKTHEMIQQEIQKLHHDYASTINNRDTRIQELETLLSEYEKQILAYGNTLQQKDKEMAEYINQITKLNDVSQKLKSTIELLEEEKAKDPNTELIKTCLNKQIAAGQKKLAESEDKIRKLEEERVQLLSVKSTLENKIVNLDSELKALQESFAEKQNIIKELKSQQQKHNDEISNVVLQLKERDEEVHEIKLQLRKESIENEKLRTALQEREHSSNEFSKQFDETKENLSRVDVENSELKEKCQITENKNKELLEKLKKFAATVKKKSTMYTELEMHFNETQKNLEAKSLQVEQLLIQVNTLPALQEKLSYAEEELNRLQSQRSCFEQQKSQDVLHLQTEIKTLQDKLHDAVHESKQINETLNIAQKELYLANEEKSKLISQIELLNNKLADYEVELKNNTNFITKISSLEADINQKQTQITELLRNMENQEHQLNQMQFGLDAKVQERDLYIESLETEINKYKGRICRLEESISIMEYRRQTLERKADQLDTQLQEKQKAYSEYTSQEDQLVGRLAILMDHDRVVEKQLHEIENENKELQLKTQHLTEENQHLRKALSDIQNHCNTMEEKANRTDHAESELSKYLTQIHELDAHLKRITHEYQTLLVDKKREIEEIESEFNTQIENAIKEKRILSEKYEKTNEHVTKLEEKLHEYRNNIETFKINIEELNKLNRDLVEKSDKEPSHSPDYTEQYINEINRLNSIINYKNQEVNDLQAKLHNVQSYDAGVVSNLEGRIAVLNSQLQSTSTMTNQLIQEINTLKSNNEQLQSSLLDKDDQIKRLTEEKSVTFEMSIPKTEGMVISSTIEPVHEGVKCYDMSSLESQIISEGESVDTKTRQTKRSEQLQKTTDTKTPSGEVTEPEIVAKKSYLCYKSDENLPEHVDDPFNSDEGWGLGEGEENTIDSLGLLTDQIQQIKMQNEILKIDLDASNNKLIKVMKKLKELKSKNDVLSNELKISKQISQSSFLDIAIEEEMKDNIQELEKKLEEITADINKERKDKESLRKQNDVLQNANERLLDMKEKMDSELELWKFKFKEINDKMSSLQWEADTKDSPEHKKPSIVQSPKDDALKEEMLKLERENDELQSTIDQLTSQNKELHVRQSQLQIEVCELTKKLHEHQDKGNNFELLNNTISELQRANETLSKKLKDVESLNDEINLKCEHLNKDLAQKFEENRVLSEKCEELTIVHTKLLELQNENENLNAQIVDLETRNKDIQSESTEKNHKLEEEIKNLKHYNSDSDTKISNLMSELKQLKLLWPVQEQASNKIPNIDLFVMSEKFNVAQDRNSQLLELQKENENLNAQIVDLETRYKDIQSESTEKNNKLEEEIKYLKQYNNDSDTKISNLMSELRQLKLLWPVQEQASNKIPNIDLFVMSEKFNVAQDRNSQLLELQKENENLNAQIVDLETRDKDIQSESTEKNNKLEEEIKYLKQYNKDSDTKISNLMSELRQLKLLWPVQEQASNKIPNIDLFVMSEKFNVAQDRNSQLLELQKENENLNAQIVDLETRYKDIQSESTEKNHKLEEEIKYLKQYNSDSDTKISNLMSELEQLKLLWPVQEQASNKIPNIDLFVMSEKFNVAQDRNSQLLELQKENENLNAQIVDLETRYKDIQSESTEKNNKLEEEIKYLKQYNNDSDTKISNLMSELRQLKLLWPVQEQASNKIPNIDLFVMSEKFNVAQDRNSQLLELQKENENLNAQIVDLETRDKDIQSESTEKNNKLEEEIKYLKQYNKDSDTKISNLMSELRQLKLLWPVQEQASNKIPNIDLFVMSEKFNVAQDRNSQLLELQKENENLNAQIVDLETRYKDIQSESTEKNHKLEEEIKYLKQYNSDSDTKISNLMSELEQLKLLWQVQEQASNKIPNIDLFAMSENFNVAQDRNSQVKDELEVASKNMQQLQLENQSLLDKLSQYEGEIAELNLKLKSISTENAQLLSTVTELRAVPCWQDTQLVSERSSQLQSTTDGRVVDKQLEEYENKIIELNAKIQHLNTENDKLLSSVAELQSSISSAVDQRGFEIAELWKQHLAQREADFQKTEQELRSELNAFEAKYEQLLDNVQSSSQEETNKLVMMEQVSSLQNKLQDKEDHLRDLQDKYIEVMNQIDMIRSEMEDEKMMYENRLMGQQEEYEKQIQEMNKKNQEHSQGYDAIYSNLQSELASTKAKNDELNQEIAELYSKVEKYEKQITELTNELRTKDSEIYQKTHDFTITLSQRNEEFENIRKQLIEYEKKIEEINYEKESELAILRLKMHESSDDFKKVHQDAEEEKLSLTQELNAKILECTNLNKQITDLNKTLEEHSKNAAEMQSALESQELEIVTLKDEITNLNEMLRASTSKIEKHVTFASDTKPGAELPSSSHEELSKELLDAVPRAELDLALYMLHQRDVRCEELTMELTQLLEERDTLQLRLSDSLRSYEDLKARCLTAGLDISISQDTLSELPSSSVEREQQFIDVHKGPSSRSSSISDPDGEKPNLQAKLSELRSVKHSRDVVLRHDSEQRQLDLRLLQRDVANLPLEAREQLAQAHHTLSRDSQSTSTVLLNWLRGKSTPKVVHM